MKTTQKRINRIKTEKQELDTKITRVYDFLISRPSIDTDQQMLLEVQYSTMKVYSDILSKRIKLMQKKLEKQEPQPKLYKCTKEVLALPMDSHTAGSQGLIRDFKEDSENTEGYKVIYKDGYESWSPKKAFEDGYAFIENENGD